MKKTILIIALLPLLVQAQVKDFDRDWSFWSDRNPQRQTVSIPHDAMQSEQRSDALADGRHNGFFPGGNYHYEKRIDVPADWLQKHVTLRFDGVYQKSSVSINGQKAGGIDYGYLPFDVCADGLLREGDNVIRVDVDNSESPNSRWYSGAGIYRPVELRVQSAEYIEEIRVQTQSVNPVIVNVSTRHQGGQNVRISLIWKGETVATGLGTNVNLNVKEAHLWSAEEPNLYKLKVELLKDGQVTDTQVKNVGIRMLNWSTEGLLVNGKQTLLRGGCLHHDNGILGACEYKDATVRKLSLLKQYGFNAIRSAHNPCSETVLQACDSLGLYVMDELWDMWYMQKTAHDYASLWEKDHMDDIESMVTKDFSHPSVIMYSIGNEVKEPAEARGNEAARQMVERLHQLDPTRPVTAGINLTIVYMQSIGLQLGQNPGGGEQGEVSSEAFNKMMETMGQRMTMATLRPQVDSVSTPVLDMLDIAGYNYAAPRYAIEAEAHPSRIVVGSETYHYQLADNWQLVEELPHVVGDFMWTAWDYIGEVSLGAWYNTDESPSQRDKYPSLLAGCGAFDLIGNPTGEAYRARAIWQRDGRPYMAVRPVSHKPLVKAIWRGTNSIPSWSWQGEEGQKAIVEVFTSAPNVKLYLNGRLVGEQLVEKSLATFEVTYEPGELKAVTDQGECILTSAKGKLHIKAQPERTDYAAGDLIFLDIDMCDANGVVESNADRQLSVQVKGAELLGFGSAQPRTEERFISGRYSTYYGQSQAILRATQPGKVVVTISGQGVKTVKQEILVN